MSIKHSIQCSEHNKYQQMSVIMVKCFRMESRMTGAGLLGAVQKLAREKALQTLYSSALAGLTQDPALFCCMQKH